MGAQADTHDRKTVLKELHVRADRTEKQKREETAASESRDTPRNRLERRWVSLKRPRCDIDGVGEGLTVVPRARRESTQPQKFVH